jgi:glycosyltransferase involved in cell wall biosynthesis
MVDSMYAATSRPSPNDGYDRIRVLHVAPEGPGGIAAAVRATFDSSLADAYDMELLVSARYDANGPRRRLMTFAAALPRLARWSRGGGCRVVHVHMGTGGSCYRKAVCVAIAKRARVPVVLHVHSGQEDNARFWNALGPVRRSLLRRTLLAADEVVSVSAATARELEAWGRPGPVAVVPNSVPIPRRAPERKPGATANVLYVGGFADPSKGAAVLLEALPQLPRDAIEVAMTGPGQPNAAAAEPLRRAGVRWLGWLDTPEKDAQFRRADIFVLPSLSEGLPLALLEAMGNGCAIVATRAGGIPEILTDGVDALLVAPGDARSLAAALRTLIADPRERARLGSAARERAARLRRDGTELRLGALYRALANGSFPEVDPAALGAAAMNDSLQLEASNGA